MRAKIAARVGLAAGILVATATPALARKWYVLDASSMTCRDAATAAVASGSPMLASPALLRAALRDTRAWGGLHVYRGSDGRIAAVVIKLETQPRRGFVYFTTLAACRSLVANAEASGEAVDPSALK